jgi:hypothetical protein
MQESWTFTIWLRPTLGKSLFWRWKRNAQHFYFPKTSLHVLILIYVNLKHYDTSSPLQTFVLDLQHSSWVQQWILHTLDDIVREWNLMNIEKWSCSFWSISFPLGIFAFSQQRFINLSHVFNWPYHFAWLANFLFAVTCTIIFFGLIMVLYCNIYVLDYS